MINPAAGPKVAVVGAGAVGGYFGGMWALKVPDLLLRRIFAVVLAVTAIRMFFQK